MCSTCGCGVGDVRVEGLEHWHDHPHDHSHDETHDHSHDRPGAELRTHTLVLEERLLARNDDLAETNRQWLRERRTTLVNVMSSPGSGKTTLLERTVREFPEEVYGPVSVIEGDQETLFDAERIRAAGARAVQVNTGAGCHLDAAMVHDALHQLDPPHGGLVFVENVGNLVCPAMFDLGEARKAVVISVTEGDDKPLKYPHMFAAADLVVVNKIDLLPYVDFDLERLAADARSLHPEVDILPVSARTGENFTNWCNWIGALVKSAANVTLDTIARSMPMVKTSLRK